jgi:nitroreductase/NAD-dependent dihydropyrimidine dehydrogenase PreA subunit
VNHVIIDGERCLHDGICVASCPTGILKLEPAGPTSSRGERCLRCGHCVSVCRSGALALTSIPRSELRPVRDEHRVTPEQVEQLLQARRSIRVFRDKVVPRELVERVLDSARFAPSGVNLQPVGWTVLEGRERVHALAGGVIEWARLLAEQKHPLAERFGFAGFVRGWEKGRDIVLRDAPCVVIAHAPAGDPLGHGAAIIAMTYLQVAAAGLGLGTCWAGYLEMALGQSAAVVELAGVPEGRTARAASMLGFAKYEYSQIPPRNPLRANWV